MRYLTRFLSNPRITMVSWTFTVTTLCCINADDRLRVETLQIRGHRVHPLPFHTKTESSFLPVARSARWKHEFPCWDNGSGCYYFADERSLTPHHPPQCRRKVPGLRCLGSQQFWYFLRFWFVRGCRERSQRDLPRSVTTHSTATVVTSSLSTLF